MYNSSMPRRIPAGVAVNGGGAWMRTADLQKWFGLSPQDIRRRLTHVKPKYKGPPWTAVGYAFLTTEGVEWCVVARGMFLALRPHLPPRVQITTELADRGGLPPAQAAGIPAAGELLPNQRLIARWVMAHRFGSAHVRDGTAVCYVVAGAGTGKTHTALEVSRRVRGRTLVLASRLAIGKQWRDAANDYLPGCGAMMFSACSAKKRADTVDGACIVIATPASALLFPPETWAKFALVIFDEVQQFCAELWRGLLAAPVPRMLGLTATPRDRPDEMDCVGYWRLGRPVIARRLPGYDRHEVEFRGRALLLRRRRPAMAAALAAASYSDRLGILAADPERNADIAAAVVGLLGLHQDKDIRGGTPAPGPADLMDGVSPATQMNVLVFAERRAGVEALVRAIAAALAPDGPDGPDDPDGLDAACAALGIFGVVAADADADADEDARGLPHVMGLKGGSSEAEINAALAGARVVVTTYSYSSVGVSLNHMNAMVLDSARRAHFYQIIRRIMRARSDWTVVRRFVHIVDEDFPQLARRRAGHRRVYESIKVRVSERAI